MTKTVITLVNCGHAAVRQGIGVGFAEDSCGYTWCYACADENQRNDLQFQARMGGYVQELTRRVTTWTGGTLGTITDLWFGGWRYTRHGRYRIRYVRMTDVHGGKWYGYGSDEYDVIHMRRCK